eukprot:scaffold299940_cov20-Prasinocladus_malaysianus.AAC.1
MHQLAHVSPHCMYSAQHYSPKSNARRNQPNDVETSVCTGLHGPSIAVGDVAVSYYNRQTATGRICNYLSGQITPLPQEIRQLVG